MFHPARIRHHPIRAAGADESGGELVEIGFAEHHRTRRAQGRHRGRIGLGYVGEPGTRGGGRQSGDVDVVLDREQHPGERPRTPQRRRTLRSHVARWAQVDERRTVRTAGDAHVDVGYAPAHACASLALGSGMRMARCDMIRSLRSLTGLPS